MNGPLTFGDLVVRARSSDDLLCGNGLPRIVTTINSEFAVRARYDRRFREVVNSSFSTIDSQLIFYLLKVRHPFTRFEKLSGCELVYWFAGLARERRWRLFLLGGRPESNSGSIRRLRASFGIQVGGYAPPPYPFSKEYHLKIEEMIRRFRPDLLFVAFGAVRQETWIHDHLALLTSLHVRYVLGCGGSFDLVSGRTRRAPRLLQRACLEGLYRLVKEPKLFRLKRLFTSLRALSLAFSSVPSVETRSAPWTEVSQSTRKSS